MAISDGPDQISSIERDEEGRGQEGSASVVRSQPNPSFRQGMTTAIEDWTSPYFRPRVQRVVDLEVRDKKTNITEGARQRFLVWLAIAGFSASVISAGAITSLYPQVAEDVAKGNWSALIQRVLPDTEAPLQDLPIQ